MLFYFQDFVDKSSKFMYNKINFKIINNFILIYIKYTYLLKVVIYCCITLKY